MQLPEAAVCICSICALYKRKQTHAEAKGHFSISPNGAALVTIKSNYFICKLQCAPHTACHTACLPLRTGTRGKSFRGCGQVRGNLALYGCICVWKYQFAASNLRSLHSLTYVRRCRIVACNVVSQRIRADARSIICDTRNYLNANYTDMIYYCKIMSCTHILRRCE